MLKTEQTQGQSVHQHGQSVWEYYQDLLQYMKGTYPLQKKWRLPDWFENYKDKILNSLYQEGKIQSYALYHDCGKPFCKIVDKKTGSVHFPDQAECSAYVWACLGGNYIVGNLISWDMILHTASSAEIKRYCEEEWDKEDAFTLLLAALAEIHSNARMFGGIESVSFKSKWKKLERRGKQICFYFEGKENE